MSTKNSLNDLLLYGLVRPADTLYFTFKGNTFRASLQPGGIIAGCTWQPPGSKKTQACFTDRGGFSSLTDWCDSCIQELLEEYATRFSGWKRCKHAATGTPMGMLRSRIQELRTDMSTTAEEELLLEQKKNVVLQERVRALELQLMAADQSTPQLPVLQDDNPFRLRL